MSKKITYIFIIPLIIVFASCTGSLNGIYKTASFYKVNTPGTIAVDDNGNEITPRRDTVREIYIVTKNSDSPIVDAVFINQVCYSTVVSKIDSNNIYVGEKLPDNQRVELKAGKNQTIWKIEIGQPVKGWINKFPETDFLFYFHVRYKNKKRLHEIKSSTELVPELHY